MKIISIEIKNFLAFKNSQKIEFKDGLNLFNGNIGSGKSSLYNAFYWCLYDKIYITDEGWIKKPKRENLLNFSELHNLKKNKSIECCVKIVVENNSEDLKNYTDSVDGIFEINRSFEIIKINESEFEKNKDELEIYYTNRSGAGFLDEIAIEDFLPEALSEYVWFQGESIDKLLDLDYSNSFKEVVDSISYIDMYDNILKLLIKAKDKFDKDLIRKQRSITSNKKAFNEWEAKLSVHKKNETDEKKIQEEIIYKIDEINLKQAEIKSKLSGFDTTKNLINKRDVIQKERRAINSQTEMLDEVTKNKLSEKWILKGLEPLLKKSSEKLLEFENWRNKLIDEERNLPEDVPGDAYLNKMIDAELCMICDRSAKKGTDEYEYIKGLLNRKHTSPLIEPETERMNDYVKALKSYPQSLGYKVDQIGKEIEDYRNSDDELTKKKNILDRREKEINKEIKGFESKEGYKIDIHEINSTRLIDKLTSLDKEEKKLSMNRQQSEYRRNTATDGIKTCKYQLGKLTNSDEQGNIALEEKNLLETEILLDAVKKTKETEYEKLIKDIESRSNEYISTTLEHNSSIKAKIEIDAKTNTIEITDQNNTDLSMLNTGHKTIIKMSIINAIISKSSEYKNLPFPFITDAPTSNLGNKDTLAYMNLISNIFEQSIVLSKDLSENIDSLKKNTKITSIFNFTPTNIDSSKPPSLENTYTEIKKIK